MKKTLLALVSLSLILSLFGVPAFGVTPLDPTDPYLVMYADEVADAGPVVPVKMGPYNGWTHAQRLCPDNALGVFDAMPGVSGFNERFFAVASREWVEYAFEDKFMNVDGVPDIEFAEVTWGSGNSWQVEAVLVYLTNATIRNGDGEIVEYGNTDNGIGYYAGIAWNRTGIAYVAPARRIEIAESYLPGVDRDFDQNSFYWANTIGWTQFNLPEEVVCAEGVYLVDITADVYGEGGNGGSYLNGSGSLVTALNCPIEGPDDVSATSGYTGNTDGYDLDAMRVFRCIPGGDDSATGMGNYILPQGQWFMYNEYPEGPYDIQAGNPKEGENIIGFYNITDNVDGTYTATYSFNNTIEKFGYEYEIVLGDEHLAISDEMNFTGAPGRDDNADFGEPFSAEEPFFVFGHWEVEYR